MEHFRVLAVVSLGVFAIQWPSHSATNAQIACATTALTDYTRAGLALLQQGGPVMSVEATMAQRRLEEQYCLRSTRCLMGEPTNSLTGMAFAAKFSKCLADEAIEKSK